MVEMNILGTGSAYPGAERDNTSIYFSNNGYHVLVDVSGNPCKKLKQINVELGELDSVMFTHFHIDHIYGLPSLLWGMWLENREKPFTLYCDKQYEVKLNKWLNTMEVDKWGIKFPIHIETFHGDHFQEIIVAGDMQISCFPAYHSVPTIGLDIRCNGKVIIYSGDTEISSYIQSYTSIDILIHEATSASNINANHTSLKEIIREYDLHKIKEVILVHLTDNEPYEEELSKLDGKADIKIAEDMMCIQL